MHFIVLMLAYLNRGFLGKENSRGKELQCGSYVFASETVYLYKIESRHMGVLRKLLI